jgi:hypothetical protein
MRESRMRFGDRVTVEPTVDEVPGVDEMSVVVEMYGVGEVSVADEAFGVDDVSGVRSSDDERRSRTPSRAIRTGTCALLPVAAALLLGACGGSSPSSSSSSSAPPSPSSAAAASSSRSGSGVSPIGRSRVETASKVRPISQYLGSDQVRPSSNRPVKARTQVGMIDDEVSATGAKTLDPCSLVSRTQAQAILGKPVGQPVDAPQGPTCIYTPQGAKSLVTVAVVATDFSKIQPQAHLRDRMSVTVSGRAAYCGVAGVPTMIVPLTPGRFLTVTAPCPIAASFATRALSHIHA